MKIKKGTILCLERGCYSDFFYEGPFIVLREFDQAEVVEEFKKQWRRPEGRGWDWKTKPAAEDIIPWLCDNNYIEYAKESYRWGLGDDYYLNPYIEGEK